MEFYSKFAWAIPHAFSDALYNCRFEEGDILYDNPAAYGRPWAESRKHIQDYIQIAFPPSMAVSTAGQVFNSNWYSEVRFDHFQGHGEPVRITSTQGRLYTALWRGALEIAKASSPEPKPPLGPKDIPRAAITESALAGLSPQVPMFVMTADYANPTMRAKIADIKTALRDCLACEPRMVEPREIDLPNWDEYAPTIDFALFEASSTTEEQLHELIKAAVYKPPKDSIRDMFRIEAHGWLIGG